MAKTKTKKSVYELITDQIITALESGTIPWQKPWKGGGAAKNLVTGKPYRGINVLMTQLRGFSSPYFCTFKQAKDIGATVRKGEKGTKIVFWNFKKIEEQNTKTGATEERVLPLVRYYTVFNLTQLDGLSDKHLALLESNHDNGLTESDRINGCESIVSSVLPKPVIKHEEQRAFYRPSTDSINMPKFESFGKPEEYYSTLFHELTHWTGHESRLNRKSIAQVNSFGSHEYSKEELVAELGAAFLCGEADISPAVIDNQAAYINSWLKVLKGDVTFVVQAAQQAQKAADFLLGKNQDNKDA